MDLLRFTTAGSVDDGKSTLIGRLLYDSKALFDDHIEALKEYSAQRGNQGIDLSHVTDGLRAEREQGITIDVAYRYFATPRRKFIIADTPGHEQYTRNMVTGASTANLAIILVDARNGIQPQSKRHGFIASLLGIRHVIVAVNKMDLVDFSQDVFETIKDDYSAFSEQLSIPDIVYIPISALLGDNIVNPSVNMGWYSGETVMHHLEHVSIAGDRNLVDFRFPVQTVLRPHQNFRGYAGTVVSGRIRPGEEVMVLPSGKTSRVREVLHFRESLPEAAEGQAAVVTLEDELDISRGDLLIRPGNRPRESREIDVTLCWMDDRKNLEAGREFVLFQNTRALKAVVKKIDYRIDVNTLHRVETASLTLNDIGRVHLRTSEPLFFDEYQKNRRTGGFILIDPHTHITVAACMIRGSVEAPPAAKGEKSAVSPNVFRDSSLVTLTERISRSGFRPAVVWFTGLSGSGKSTLASRLERQLFDLGAPVLRLDGDDLRHGLCGDLGFADEDRHENIRRAGETAKLFYKNGLVVLCSFISPFKADRDKIRASLPAGDFVEVFVDCPLDVCRARDPKGLYNLSEKQKNLAMTGVASPYEAPEKPELHLKTAESGPEELLAALKERVLEAIKLR